MSIVNDPLLSPGARSAFVHELGHLRSHWWWFVALGAILVACGTVALVYPLVGTAAVIGVLAALFLIAGIATIISAVWMGRWSGTLVQLLVGVLYIVAAFVATERPTATALIVTVFIAAAMMIGGAFRLSAALMIRYPQWGWSLLNGIVTLLLGLVIFRNLPVSILVIGILVGVELMFSGWTWLMIGMAVRNLPKATPSA